MQRSCYAFASGSSAQSWKSEGRLLVLRTRQRGSRGGAPLISGLSFAGEDRWLHGQQLC